MIDRLEEVLGKGDSREELARLEELLRQRGVAASLAAQEMEVAPEEPNPVGQTAPVPMDGAAVASGAGDPGADEAGRGTDSDGATADAKRFPEEQTGLPELLRGMESAALPDQKTGVEFAPEGEERQPPFPLPEDLSPLTGGADTAAIEAVAVGREEVGELAGLTSAKQNAAALAALMGRAAEGGSFLSPAAKVDRTALLSLYRQTVQAASPMGRTGVSAAPMVIREEYAVGGDLSVQELDLAVRRDSRRYDGAVHIY